MEKTKRKPPQTFSTPERYLIIEWTKDNITVEQASEMGTAELREAIQTGCSDLITGRRIAVTFLTDIAQLCGFKLVRFNKKLSAPDVMEAVKRLEARIEVLEQL